MHYLLIFVVVALCTHLPVSGFTSFATHCDSTQQLSDKAFLESFPYPLFFEKTNLSDYNSLEQNRLLLDSMGRKGDEFIYTLAEQYTKIHPVNIQDFEATKSLIELGGMYLLTLEKIQPDRHLVYEAIGDDLLSQVAAQVEQGIKKGTLDKHHWQTRYLIERLKTYKLSIDIPMSKWEKLTFNVQKGNWAYLWTRATGRYLKEMMGLSISGLFVLLGGIFFLKKRRKV